MAESPREFWNAMAAYPPDASIIDPNDRLGHKNRYLAGLRNASILSALGTLQAGDRVLDFGCGTGSLTAALCTTPAQVVGIDIAESLLRQARERGLRAGLLCFGGRRLPIADHCIAAITSYVVFGHILDDRQLADALADCVRVLRPDGRMVLIEQVRRRRHHDRAGWKVHRTLDEYRQQFAAAGLELIGHRVIRYGRFPATALVRRGWLPTACFGGLAAAESWLGSVWGVPRYDYCDVRFVLQPAARA